MGRKLKSPDTFFCKKKNLNKTSETVSCLFSYLIMKVRIYRLLTARCSDFIYWLYHAKTWWTFILSIYIRTGIRIDCLWA